MKTRALFAALCLADMSLAQESVNAIELVFTKNSPTDLTATFDGQPLSVFNAGNNLWEGTLPSGFIFGGANLAQWTEPENSSLVNRVGGGDSSFEINGHTTAIAFPAPVADGTRVSFDTLVTYGNKSINAYATFFDKAASAEGGPSVPT
jgi:hypothetical protein